MHIYADGIHFHTEIHQSRPELPFLVLFHGFMGTGRSFSHLINPLKEFCNPVTIDLAGHGRTVNPPDPDLFRAERQVRQLASVFTRLKFDHLYAYGYSMGGRLLFQLLAAHPRLFRGAIIESAHCGLPDAEKPDRVKTDEQRAAEIEENADRFIEKWVSMPLFRHTPQKQAELYRQQMMSQKPECMAASLRGFGAGVMPRVCEQLQQLQLPLYLVAGEYDSAYVERMKQITPFCTNSTFQTISGAGHRVHTDRPDALIHILKTFIQNHHV
jgi:2-succinyl-6-hydroxy-2,4-cyclohexadiene-1-carboxylate synthase